jgi:Flp pilus assembly pilin Flp
MTARPPRRWLRRDCHGTTAVEFAVIAGVLLPMLFGILSLGFLMWTHNALQSTAALTARCVALGSSQCAANPEQFAVNTAQQWIVPGIINAGDVKIHKHATSCNDAAGSFGPFVTVTITSTYWASNILPQPFAATTLKVSACFPVLAGATT